VPPIAAPDVDFTAIAGLVDTDIAAHRLPGAVIQIGHAGDIVLRQAYGWRKLPGEPSLDGVPGPGEPMTPDTLFDMASLTKLLATTPAVLQLYEQGKVAIDEPVQTYLPDFNPAGDPRRAQVTVRMLLTHTSGIGGDLSRQGPWGVVAADKADGLHRALGAPLEFDPGQTFHYSDIGFILLGEIVERITGEPLDIYTSDHIFAPLGMTDTRYIPAAKACGPHRIRGNAIAVDPAGPATEPCPEGTWSTDLLSRVAPTSRDEDTVGLNPDFDYPLRGTVHDPTARRMGGVAGSAGVFSTAPDVGRFAQALLDRLAGRPSAFPLQQATVELMTTPQQPASVANGVRGFGWDIDTYQSTPRGTIFPVGSFGHTGFTGVSMWMDPGSDTYVIVLANVIHQRGGPPISTLSGEVATAAARALHLYGS
jgi:CubicO group peptidase (beta-lactamase class C family)